MEGEEWRTESRTAGVGESVEGEKGEIVQKRERERQTEREREGISRWKGS